MRKICILLIVVFFIAIGNSTLWAGGSFHFPQKIYFKILKNDRVMGSCRLDYLEKGKKERTSTLKLIDFEGFGMSSQQWLISYIFSNDASIYGTFVMEGKKRFSEIRLKEGIGFDGKKGNVFVYKEFKGASAEMQTELFTKFPVIDLVSTFFVSARKVAAGPPIKTEKFNFIFGKSTKIMDMIDVGEEKVNVPFKEKAITTHVLEICYNNLVIFRFKVYKDSDGFCFPVSVMVYTDFDGNNKGKLELKAHKVIK